MSHFLSRKNSANGGCNKAYTAYETIAHAGVGSRWSIPRSHPCTTVACKRPCNRASAGGTEATSNLTQHHHANRLHDCTPRSTTSLGQTPLRGKLPSGNKCRRSRISTANMAKTLRVARRLHTWKQAMCPSHLPPLFFSKNRETTHHAPPLQRYQLYLRAAKKNFISPVYDKSVGTGSTAFSQPKNSSPANNIQKETDENQHRF